MTSFTAPTHQNKNSCKSWAWKLATGIGWEGFHQNVELWFLHNHNEKEEFPICATAIQLQKGARCKVTLHSSSRRMWDEARSEQILRAQCDMINTCYLYMSSRQVQVQTYTQHTLE